MAGAGAAGPSHASIAVSRRMNALFDLSAELTGTVHTGGFMGRYGFCYSCNYKYNIVRSDPQVCAGSTAPSTQLDRVSEPPRARGPSAIDFMSVSVRTHT